MPTPYQPFDPNLVNHRFGLGDQTEYRDQGLGAAEYSGPLRNQAVQRLARHMEDISDDPSGSAPEAYLSRADAQTVNNFVRLANFAANELRNERDLSAEQAPGWTVLGADRFAMRVPRRGLRVYRGQEGGVTRPFAWTSSLHTAKAGLTKAMFMTQVGAEHTGFIFGRLADAKPTQSVAITDDGCLRSQRGTELTRSKAVGWGRLPDPDMLEPALDVGQRFGVDYTHGKSLSLREQLVSRLPAAFRTDEMLEAFDL